MSSLSKFLGKFASEYREVGGAIATIAMGVALDPSERAKVQGVVDVVQKAADNIEASLEGAGKLADAGLSKSQLKAALKEVVAELLPDMLAGLVETAVRDAVKLPASTK